MENYLQPGREKGDSKKPVKISYVDLSGTHPVVRIGLAAALVDETKRSELPEEYRNLTISCSSVNG